MRDTTTEPQAVPPAFADVIDAIRGLGHGQDGGISPLDQVIAELTTDQLETLKTLGALAELHHAATNSMTFSEWLSTSVARRGLNARRIAEFMDSDGNWPRSFRTYGDFRNYVVDHHPYLAEDFDRAWGFYRAAIIAPYGDAGTIREEVQYATLIAWRSGYDEIHPRTANGTSRFEAARHAEEYNDLVWMQAKRRPESQTETDPTSSAAVVRRAVIYGPWCTA